MSVTSLGHVRSAGVERAAFVPKFLLRDQIRPVELHSVQLERLRWPASGSTAVLLGSGLAAALFAVGFGGYVLVENPPTSEPGSHAVHPAATMEKGPATSAPAALSSDAAKAATEAGSQQSVTARMSQAPDVPRVVRTERVGGDPSVWANVRKFSPLPDDEVPNLDVTPGVKPTIAHAAAPESASGGGKPHGRSARAQPHRRNRARLHARVTHAPAQDGAAAPSDVGGTQMTSAELRRDASNNPVVNALSSVFGPK